MRDEKVLYLLVSTSMMGNKMYWNGFYWTKKMASGKIYKSFQAIMRIKAREIKRTKKNFDDYTYKIGPGTEYLLVNNIRVEAYELLSLGERTDEDLNEI